MCSTLGFDKHLIRLLSFVIQFANGLGAILGNLVGALIRTLLTDEQLLSYGWRIAFLIGVLIAPVAAFLHFCAEEHNPNEGEYDDEGIVDDGSVIVSISSSLQQKQPLTEALQMENVPALVSSFLTPMLAGAGYYITFVW